MSAMFVAPVRVNPVLSHPAEIRMKLDGPWLFRLDPDDQGLTERWFEDVDKFTGTIAVPGCWQGQGFGHDGKDMLYDFKLAARVFRATYAGTGWYAIRFSIPESFLKKRIWLNFGGVHPSADVWLNGVRLGEQSGPFVPFGFEITDHVLARAENFLVVRVHEKDRDIGFSFNWQGNWSGLYRAVELTATGPSFIESLWLRPDVDSETLHIMGKVAGLERLSGKASLKITAMPLGLSTAATAEVEVNSVEVEHRLSLPGPALWSPDAPNLYRVDACLVSDGRIMDAQSERVGFVKLTAEDKRIKINGAPYYMRGSGDHALCTWTGTEYGADREGWRRKLRTLRDYGYNYVRCVSIAPTPEYFDAADEVGLLVQSDMGMLGGWSGGSVWHVYNWPYPMPDYREKIKWQWDCVVARDVNHPSANMYSMSNELQKLLHFPRIAWQCYHDTKRIKPTSLVIYTDGGYLKGAPQDFACVACDDIREGQQPDIPVIMHEFRWWSSYPDVRIADKYSGPIRPYAARIAEAAAERHGIMHVLAKAAENSQRLQFVEAKAKMEICRRDNGMPGYEYTGKAKLPEAANYDLAGICHFNAMDTNPSPQGIIDEFYEQKYATAAMWRQTNGDCVLLSSLGFDDRVLTSREILTCKFFVSDYTHPSMVAPTIEWRLVGGNDEISFGQITYKHVPYCTQPAGSMRAAIPDLPAPTAARLEARLSEGERVVTNQWDLWLFPAQTTLPKSLARYGESKHTWLKTLDSLPVAATDALAHGDFRTVLTERLDEALVQFAWRGGRVILAASEGLIRPFAPKFGHTFGHYFNTPPANYGPYEDGHDGTIIAEHPMLGQFPCEGFADLQFFRMMANAPPIQLEPFGLGNGDPIIRVMHSYPVARSLGYLCEVSVGAGGLVLSALDLDQSLTEARYLLSQICEYVCSDNFSPKLPLSSELLKRIVTETSLP